MAEWKESSDSVFHDNSGTKSARLQRSCETLCIYLVQFVAQYRISFLYYTSEKLRQALCRQWNISSDAISLRKKRTARKRVKWRGCDLNGEEEMRIAGGKAFLATTGRVHKVWYSNFTTGRCEWAVKKIDNLRYIYELILQLLISDCELFQLFWCHGRPANCDCDSARCQNAKTERCYTLRRYSAVVGIFGILGRGMIVGEILVRRSIGAIL